MDQSTVLGEEANGFLMIGAEGRSKTPTIIYQTSYKAIKWETSNNMPD